MKKIIWITWEQHRRTETLAAKLKIPLFCFNSSLPRIMKHPWLLFCTIIVLLKYRPMVLFVQNPSAFLTIEAILLRPFFRYKLVVDAHNAGVYPFQKKHEKFAIVYPFIHRQADLTIVTNSVLAEIVDRHGGKALILPDALPDFQNIPIPVRDSDDFIVTFICSYASDEPFLEVIKAGNLLPDYIKIYITGDDNKLVEQERALAGSNIIFTGYLTEQEFLQQLVNSDVIMDLTTFNDCIVCGAYESTALNIPLVLSDTPVLRAWFFKGVIYSKNVTKNITNSILEVQKNKKQLNKEIMELHVEMAIKWEQYLLNLKEHMNEIMD